MGKDGADGKDGIDGTNGKDGTNGVDGVGIANVTISDEGALSVELTNGTILNLGNIKGENGIGISKSEINADGELILTYTNGETNNLGKVVGTNGTNGTNGADGQNGADGVGIKTVTLSTDGNLSILMTDNTVYNLGNVKGEKGDKGDKGDTGEKGADGRGIADMEIINGELVVTYTDGTTDNLGSIGSGTSTEDKEILIFTLLSDDTYSVSAGNGAKNVDSIEIPSTYNGKAVTQIADKAFMNLSNLTKITIPDSITKIGEYAFYDCTLLSNIILPSSLQSIQKYAFSGCTSITEITIPSATTYIGEYAFYNSSLSNATFEETNGWTTTYDSSKKQKGAILLFSFSNWDYNSSGVSYYYTDYEWGYFSRKSDMAQILSGDYSTSYYVYRTLNYRTVSMYKYAWSRS